MNLKPLETESETPDSVERARSDRSWYVPCCRSNTRRPRRNGTLAQMRFHSAGAHVLHGFRHVHNAIKFVLQLLWKHSTAPKHQKVW